MNPDPFEGDEHLDPEALRIERERERIKRPGLAGLVDLVVDFFLTR